MIKTIEVNLEDGINATVNFNELNVFVGKNGVGKTMMLKLAWIGSYLATACQVISFRRPPEELDQLKETTTTVFKYSFDLPDFNGNINYTFTDGESINFILKDGACIEFTHNNFTPDSKIPQVVFMSKELRLFTEMVRYLKTRRRINENFSLLNPEHLIEILEDYKIYDVSTVEKFLSKLPIEFTPEQGQMLVENYDFQKKPKQLSVDLDTSRFYLMYDDESQIDVLTLGSGHQSILNMTSMNIAAH